MRNIYIQLLNELKDNKSLVLATIIETKGSTPQVPGASALFSTSGLYAGTVGGGGLEADAQRKAIKALQQKVSILYKFDLTADISSEEAICGGEATILIDACPEENAKEFQDMSESISKRHPGVLATFITRHSENKASRPVEQASLLVLQDTKKYDFPYNEKVYLERYWIDMIQDLAVNPNVPYANFSKEIHKSLEDNKPALIDMKETMLFLEPVYPLPHLVIAGAGHVGQAVSHLGSLLDFEVTVIDDRPEFANKEKLPDADNIIIGDIETAMQAIPKSYDTYVVIVTRGHKNDADALKQCINSKAAYVGMIGSKRKVGLMREKFLQEGWATPEQWDGIYTPIGIDIQSKTVQEIAVSIAAQLVLVRQQRQNRKDEIWSGP